MRESNFSNAALNRACVTITSSVYDRRALDSTSTLPLINSLNHLAYLTSTSPRIREMVTLDGGLERLVQILQRVPPAPSPSRPATNQLIRSIWKWSLAFQCAVNIGVRGSEHVRIRVVDAGMIPITVNVLESYLNALDQVVGQDRAARHAEKNAAAAVAAAQAASQQLSSRRAIEGRSTYARHVSAPVTSTSLAAAAAAASAQQSGAPVPEAAQSRRRHHGHSRQNSSKHSNSSIGHAATDAAVQAQPHSEDDAASSSMDESSSSASLAQHPYPPSTSHSQQQQQMEEDSQMPSSSSSSSLLTSRRNALIDGVHASSSSNPGSRSHSRSRSSRHRHAIASSSTSALRSAAAEQSAIQAGPSHYAAASHHHHHVAAKPSASSSSASFHADGARPQSVQEQRILHPVDSAPAHLRQRRRREASTETEETESDDLGLASDCEPVSAPDSDAVMSATTAATAAAATADVQAQQDLSSSSGGAGLGMGITTFYDADFGVWMPSGLGVNASALVGEDADEDVHRSRQHTLVPPNRAAGQAHTQPRDDPRSAHAGGPMAGADWRHHHHHPSRDPMTLMIDARGQHAGPASAIDLDDGALDMGYTQGPSRAGSVSAAADAGAGPAVGGMPATDVAPGGAAPRRPRPEEHQHDDAAAAAADAVGPTGTGPTVLPFQAPPQLAGLGADQPGNNGLHNGASSVPSSSRPLPEIIYREEEVLFSLQLLAYVSKYPHVRELFHTVEVVEGSMPEWYSVVASAAMSGGGSAEADAEAARVTAELLSQYATRTESWDPHGPQRKTVFSIAERFTPKGASARSATKYYPRLAGEIQEWAGVIMRNACRKDDSRGGVRQCANMLCGRWEEYPREFAKCRRCRKAKYCSKQCQSKGWAMGHRYWCNSAKDEDAHDEAALSKGAEKRADANAAAAVGNADAAAAEGPGPAQPSPAAAASFNDDAADALIARALEAAAAGGDGGRAAAAAGAASPDVMATPTVLQPQPFGHPHSLVRPSHFHAGGEQHDQGLQRTHQHQHSGGGHQRSHSADATPRIRALADIEAAVGEGEVPMELDTA